jgi:hypothetical protein
LISKFEQIEELFKKLDEIAKEKINLFIIGGAVMLYHGLKSATKDIDIVVDTIEEFNAFQNIMIKQGFKIKIPSAEYNKFNLSQIFVMYDYRIDIFHKKVCKGFALSDNMKKRSEKIISMDNISVYLCSSTDIFMFKTFTEREGDIDDCILLAQHDIDWKSMLTEINNQIQKSGNPIWITYIGERLDLLVERGLNIPIMNKINKLREEFFDSTLIKNDTPTR